MKRTVITEITVQEGSYLTELLLDKEYEVHVIVRRVASEGPQRRMWGGRNLFKNVCIHSATTESYALFFNNISDR
ncbi:hypothetical protein ACFL7M_02990 [Thermodesulfobacteriota bacterium]